MIGSPIFFIVIMFTLPIGVLVIQCWGQRRGGSRVKLKEEMVSEKILYFKRL